VSLETAEKDPGVSEEALQESEAGTSLSVLSALGQDLPGRHPGPCLRDGQSQGRSTWGGGRRLRGDRGGRAGQMAGRVEIGVDRGTLSAASRAPGKDPESQWGSAAARNPDPTGAGGVDGHRCTKNQPERWCPSVVQTAAKRVVEPIGEAGLEPNAYGYRRKRSAQDAIRKVQQCLRQGYTEGVDADRSKYFDTIPHAERDAVGSAAQG
jgi:hypothetical protein